MAEPVLDAAMPAFLERIVNQGAAQGMMDAHRDGQPELEEALEHLGNGLVRYLGLDDGEVLQRVVGCMLL